jgi:peptidoglycan/xylan/chitin deacetylase (PgdA/CDA1 family)
MKWLREHGFQTIRLSELVRCLADRRPLPARSVVLTFDDGFESVYTEAFPILARYGFTATVFLVGDSYGGQNDWPGQPALIPRFSLLNWAQIRELAQYGIDFGGHTLTHPRLDRLGPAQLRQEIVTAQARLEEQLGHPVELFAYPYGSYSAAAKALVEQTYCGACSVRLGVVSGHSDRYALERIEAAYLPAPLMLECLRSRPLLSTYLGTRAAARRLAHAAGVHPWQ